MGGCQNHGSFLGPQYNTARGIWGTQKGAIILTTTHMGIGIQIAEPEKYILETRCSMQE